MIVFSSGLPLSGNGNHWKQFPPPAATSSRRHSSIQTSSRASFMRKNETDSEVEKGGAANIPFYNSTPADLVVEGNTSQINESCGFWQSDNSVYNLEKPQLRSKTKQYLPCCNEYHVFTFIQQIQSFGIQALQRQTLIQV